MVAADQYHSSDMTNLVTDLEATKRQLSCERQIVSDLEDQLSSLSMFNLFFNIFFFTNVWKKCINKFLSVSSFFFSPRKPSATKSHCENRYWFRRNEIDARWIFNSRRGWVCLFSPFDLELFLSHLFTILLFSNIFFNIFFFLKIYSQSKMCRRCLRSDDDDALTVPDYASSIACTEDGDDSSLVDLNITSSTQSAFRSTGTGSNQVSNTLEFWILPFLFSCWFWSNFYW